MKQQKIFLSILFLFVVSAFIASAQAEVTVTLNSPADNTTLTSYVCSFDYTPTFNETDGNITAAYLYLNGTLAASNITTVENATLNNFHYVFATNGTYIWTVLINTENNTYSPAANYTVTIAVPPPEVIDNGTSSGSDFTLISIFMCAFSFAFLVLGIKEDVFPRNIIFLTLSTGVSFATCLVELSLNSPYSVVFSQVFLFFGIVSLILLVISGILSLNARRPTIFGNIYKK